MQGTRSRGLPRVATVESPGSTDASPTHPDLSRIAASASRSHQPALRVVVGFVVFVAAVNAASVLELPIPGWAAIAAIVAGPLAVPLVAEFIAHRRLHALAGSTLELHDARLRQRGPDGPREIDLSEPFTFEYRYKEQGVAIYRLHQYGDTLDFSSQDPLAEPLARDVLRVAWPPHGRRITT